MSKDEIVKRLKELDNTGKPIVGEIKGTVEKEVKGIIIDEVSHVVDEENKYVIQQIYYWDGEIRYRFGYYTFDANHVGLRYGESSPIMMSSDFSNLIRKAEEKGWI